MTMDKQQAAREFEEWAMQVGYSVQRYSDGSYFEEGMTERFEGYQAATASLMPVLVEARDAIIEARRNIDEVDNALADSFMWDALARLNTCIGEK